MQIPAKYRERDDLSWLNKWIFTIKDYIGASTLVRRIYKRWFLLPNELKDNIFFVWFTLGIAVPAFFVWAGEALLERFFGYDAGGKIGLALSAVAMLTFAYYVPWGWLLVALELQFVLGIALMDTMDDYERELKKK